MNQPEDEQKESKLANKFLWWVVAVCAAILLVLFLGKFVSAQDIERKYDGINKIRVYGYNPNQQKRCDIMFPGGGFVSQNWQVCNAWKVQSVSAGHVCILAGYSTSWFPSLPAAEKGISDGVNALNYIKSHAEELGVNPDSIFLWGSSAGGGVAVGIVYEHKQKVCGVINGWGFTLQKSYLLNNDVPVFNISTDFDKIVPINCGNAFGVACCGSQAISEELTRLNIKTDWLVFEGYKHGLVPKDAGYKQRVADCFTQALQFFND